MTGREPAVLVLEDGRVFRGQAYGAVGTVFGEAVFHTGMTGYQEILTDPSYRRQIVVMTAPHIGNTGVNDDDDESDRIWVAGYVVRDPARVASSWRATEGLATRLARHGVVGISGVDTRALTRHLRDHGAMRAVVSSEGRTVGSRSEEHSRLADLVAAVRASPGMVGADLTGEVSTAAPYVVPAVGRTRWRVAALDLGIKRTTPRRLAARGVEVHVLPASASLEDLLAVGGTGPDGVFVSNGPGDPATAHHAVAVTRGALEHRVPLFGICLGHQVLGRALGLRTYKLRYGHHGINQPVRDLATGRVAVTAHNHGFALRWPDPPAATPPAGPQGTGGSGLPGGPVAFAPVETPWGAVAASHVCLNDGVVEGLRVTDPAGTLRAFSVQYHPEAAAGPHDADPLFDQFVALMAGEPAPGGARDAAA